MLADIPLEAGIRESCGEAPTSILAEVSLGISQMKLSSLPSSAHRGMSCQGETCLPAARRGEVKVSETEACSFQGHEDPADSVEQPGVRMSILGNILEFLVPNLGCRQHKR